MKTVIADFDFHEAHHQKHGVCALPIWAEAHRRQALHNFRPPPPPPRCADRLRIGAEQAGRMCGQYICLLPTASAAERDRFINALAVPERARKMRQVVAEKVGS